jgi:hypothetical protein
MTSQLYSKALPDFVFPSLEFFMCFKDDLPGCRRRKYVSFR